jgi:hypothetical protein
MEVGQRTNGPSHLASKGGPSHLASKGKEHTTFEY